MDWFFGDQLIGFALKLRNPTPINFVTTTDYIRPNQLQGVLDALRQEDVRFVMWYSGLPVSMSGDASGNQLAPLLAYLQTNYHVARVFSNHDLIWERSKIKF